MKPKARKCGMKRREKKVVAHDSGGWLHACDKQSDGQWWCPICNGYAILADFHCWVNEKIFRNEVKGK
jgi:hypothetical protein